MSGVTPDRQSILDRHFADGEVLAGQEREGGGGRERERERGTRGKRETLVQICAESLPSFLRFVFLLRAHREIVHAGLGLRQRRILQSPVSLFSTLSD